MRTIGVLFNEGGSVPLRMAADQITTTQEEQSGPGGRFSPEVQAKARDARAVELAVERVSKALGVPVRAAFSRNAGCGMCPCSPGFRLQIDEKAPLTEAARSLLESLRWVRRSDRVYAGFVISAKDGVIIDTQEPKSWSRITAGAGA